MIRTLPLISLLFMSHCVLAQAPTPSDLELRSAYCLSVNKSFVESFERFGNSGGLHDRTTVLRSNVDRLQTYLDDKASRRTLVALANAKRRADADLAASSAEISSCLRRCENASQPGQCVATCKRESGVQARLEACEKVDWLPY